MNTINFTVEQTFGISVLVLLIGSFLINRIKFLEKFCIPAPVVGGLIMSLVALFFYKAGIFRFVFDETIKDFFMICFFATIGFSADLEVLKSGGKAVFKFLGITIILVVLQNILGVGVAIFLGENPLLGMATGSIPMIGGHGTSAAFGIELIKSGLSGGTTYTLAAATFGLLAGSFIGGPVAKRLIGKNNLETPYSTGEYKEDIEEVDKDDKKETHLTAENLLTAFVQIAITVGIGSVITGVLNKLLADTKITFPAYIGAMIVAAIMRNTISKDSSFSIKMEEIDSLGHIFLSFFLAQALMTLKLWELAELALPMTIILLLQTLMMFLWATYVTFNVMGRDYDAAVLAAGNCGFGMGATPNAMANMKAVTANYGPSPKAFFILPIIGSLFIDFINVAIIAIFLSII